MDKNTERLDKLVAVACGISRAEAGKRIKSGAVTADGVLITNPQTRLLSCSLLSVDGHSVSFKRHVYIMLNKPMGVVSSTDDKINPTVLSLIPEGLYRPGLFPAGRLDKDTTGFVLITDDGDFAHRILSPKNHVPKTYIVTLDRPVSDEDISRFIGGLTLADGTVCLAASLTPDEHDRSIVRVVLHEGMYHQIKRMFGVLGIGVNALTRTHIGGVALDEGLKPGECRELTSEERAAILNID